MGISAQVAQQVHTIMHAQPTLYHYLERHSARSALLESGVPLGQE